MDRLLTVQTALSLGFVAFMVLAAYGSSLLLLPKPCSTKTKFIFLWLAFDGICHLCLKGSFLYLSTQSRTVNASNSFLAYLWQDYAKADARWGTADPTLVSMEFVTVLVAGPLAGFCAWLLAKGEMGDYYYWVTVLSAGEIYGGWMTFAPEWLVGSGELATSDWLLLWVYLVFFNLVWVVIPIYLMFDSYRYIVGNFGGQQPSEPTRKSSRIANKTPAATLRTTGSLTSPRSLSGSAYLLLPAGVFLYIMPTASAANTSASTTLLPYAESETWTRLKSILVPTLLPLGLVSFTFMAGALTVCDKALRNVRRSNRSRRRKLLASLGIDEKRSEARRIIGFFHPYCNAGGGGERVLYEAISLHLSLNSTDVIVVYTGDFPKASKEDILAKASNRFGIDLDAMRIAMVGLERRWMVEDAAWKSWTLLGQSYGSVWLGFEALSRLIPDVFIDSMGYAFTYPVVKLLDRKVPVGGYVHYPVISTDMLGRVERREAGHTNDAATANSRLRSRVKLAYYRIFAGVYTWALGRADVVVGNGSWTQAHLNKLLERKEGTKGEVKAVYPPCNTQQMSAFQLEDRTRTIVSLAQFRPEKEHATQLRILARLVEIHPKLFDGANPVKLTMMGSCRGEEDEKRIDGLKDLARSLHIEKHVEFLVNANFPVILERLQHASVGLSTMKDEHFGINVVEFMASGLITVSHKSAGPWLDIAFPSVNKPVPGKQAQASNPTVKGVGYHAESVQEFAQVLADVFQLQESQPETCVEMRKAARERAQKVFGRNAFVKSWQECLWSKLEAKVTKKNKSE